MKVAVIYNKPEIQDSDVINVFGMTTKERYNPKMVENVASSLEKGGHNVRVIEGNMRVIDELQLFMPRVISGERPGMVFNMAYGIQGYSRYTHIPAMLEMLGIPYVGSNPPGHAIALDKVMSKIVFRQHSLPTPDFWVYTSSDSDYADIVYPVIVKPKMEAVSYGLKVVDNARDLEGAVRFVIEEFQQQALVEAFIPGREFAVGLLGNGPTLEILPIVEIDLEGDPNAIQSAEDKLQRPRRKICPATLTPEQAEQARNLARSAFNALGLYDFARVDFRMDSAGKLCILEINSMASLGITGSYVHAAKVAGYSYDALANRMLDVAAERYFGKEIREGESEQKAPPLRVRVRSYLRSQQQTLVDILSEFVGIHSSIDNTDGVNALGKLLSNRFQRLGFSRQIYPQSEVGNFLYFTNHQEEENDILILGHLDTAHDPRDYIPFYEDGSRIYGTGVAESKGGLVVTLAALRALRHARALRKFRCGVFIITDASLGARFSCRLISDLAEQSKYIANTTAGETNGGLVSSCWGSRSYQVDFTVTKGAETFTSPNIMSFVAQKILSWQKIGMDRDGVLLDIRSIRAETKPGRGSDNAQINILIRFDESSPAASLDKEIVKISEKGTGKNVKTVLRRGILLKPVICTAQNQDFYQRVREIAKRLEIRLEEVQRARSSVISHVPVHKPVLGGFGPVGGIGDSPNEYIIRDSLLDRAALLAMTIHDCARKIE